MFKWSNKRTTLIWSRDSRSTREGLIRFMYMLKVYNTDCGRKSMTLTTCNDKLVTLLLTMKIFNSLI